MHFVPLTKLVSDCVWKNAAFFLSLVGEIFKSASILWFLDLDYSQY